MEKVSKPKKEYDLITVVANPEFRAQLEYICKANDRSMSNQVRYLVKQEYLRLKSLAIR